MTVSPDSTLTSPMPPLPRIEIDLVEQRLCLRLGSSALRTYAVSTARNGPGERMNSECTPRGRHRVAARIGRDAEVGTVFVGRRPTGEIHTPAWAATQPADRDWILTRILWLAGCEPGLNQGGEVDTQARYIYIHGTPDSVPLGRAGSRGCIRMRNSDVMELFEGVEVGTPVLIR